MQTDWIVRLIAAAALVVGTAAGQTARATYIITMQQVGNDVVAVGSGSLDLADIPSSFSGGDTGYVQAENGLIILNGLNSSADDYHTGIAGPQTFGSGSEFAASSGSGDVVGVEGIYGSSAETIIVPSGFTSGDLGTSMATWDNASYASLGVMPGIYVWTWGVGTHADSLTLEIEPAPEPTSIALLGTALVGFGVRNRRLKRRPIDTLVEPPDGVLP